MDNKPVFLLYRHSWKHEEKLFQLLVSLFLLKNTLTYRIAPQVTFFWSKGSKSDTNENCIEIIRISFVSRYFNNEILNSKFNPIIHWSNQSPRKEGKKRVKNIAISVLLLPAIAAAAVNTAPFFPPNAAFFSFSKSYFFFWGTQQRCCSVLLFSCFSSSHEIFGIRDIIMIAASTSLKFFKVQFCPVFWQNPGNYSEGCCALLPYQNRTTIHQKHF